MLTIWNKLPAPVQGAVVMSASFAVATGVMTQLAALIGKAPTVVIFTAIGAVFGAWLASAMDD